MSEQIPFLDLRPFSSSSFHIRPLRSHIDAEDDAHRHNFQEIIWVESGNGRHQIDEAVLELKPSTFYLIAKGQVHHFLGGQELVGYLVRFTDDFLLETASISVAWNYRVSLFNNVAGSNVLGVETAVYDEFVALLHMMAREHNSAGHYGQSELLRHLLSVLLLKLERLRQEQVVEVGDGKASGEDTAVFNTFLHLLEMQYKETHLVADYADKMGITPRQLSRILQQLTGRSAKQLIDQRLILDAKRYLRHTNYSVKELSYLLGYKDPSYFSRVFRRLTGVSPKGYRG